MKLSKSDNLPSQKELAEQIGVSAAAISGALKKLEDDGLVMKKIGSDNRFNEIIITEKGKNIVLQTKKIFSEIDRSLFRGFSDNDLLILEEYLRRIKDNFQNDREEK
jgi:DNA-binding MarR family transcriptional regulator